MNNILAKLQSITDKSKKRRGRGLGSGRGAKSGRGTTRHQKAREKVPLHFEGGQGRLVKKFPLLRGKGKNKSPKRIAYVLYTKDLNRFKEGDIIDVKKLQDAGLVGKTSASLYVKVILNGKLERKLTVKLPISQSAKNEVEKAGGTVVPL